MSFVLSKKRQCYRYTKTKNRLIKDAAEFCHKNGDKLPIPQSQNEHELLMNLLKNQSSKNIHFPIDLQLNSFNIYVMSNGKEPTWTKWFPGRPGNHGNHKQEFVMHRNTSWSGDWGLWWDHPPTEAVNDIVCQQVCSSGT